MAGFFITKANTFYPFFSDQRVTTPCFPFFDRFVFVFKGRDYRFALLDLAFTMHAV
jgi:hypothetical protein